MLSETINVFPSVIKALVLILIVMEHALGVRIIIISIHQIKVLILILMEHDIGALQFMNRLQL